MCLTRGGASVNGSVVRSGGVNGPVEILARGFGATRERV